MKQSFSYKSKDKSLLIHPVKESSSQQSVWYRLSNQNTLLLLMMGIIGLLLLGMPGAFIAWLLILVWSLQGVDEAFEALLLSVFISVVNPAIFAILPFTVILRWLVFATAIVRIGYEIVKSDQKAWFPGQTVFFLFIADAVVAAIFVSPILSLSLVKIAQFAVGVSIIYLGASHLVKRDWISNIIGFGTIILLISYVAMLLGFGYERNRSGFQGITIHPQTLGLILSITLAVAIAQWVLKEVKITPSRFILLILLAWGLYLTEARTGVIALIISLIFSSLLLFNKSSFTWRRLIFHPMLYFSIAFILLYVIFNPNTGQDITRFFEKSSNIALQQDDLLNSAGNIYYSSRGALVDLSMSNFRDSPIWGIGFGIPSFVTLIESSLGSVSRILPNAVTVGGFIVWTDAEKGFIGTAVLEETGIIGTVLISLFLLANLFYLRKRADIVRMTLFIVAFAVNIGEAVFFSFGGLGRYTVICMAIAVTSIHSTKFQSDVNFIKTKIESDT